MNAPTRSRGTHAPPLTASSTAPEAAPAPVPAAQLVAAPAAATASAAGAGPDDGAEPTAAGTHDAVTAGSTIVAVTLLLVLGVVMGIGAARYTEGDLARLLGALGPLLGVVSGAFVTYFFSRSALQSSNRLARASADAASLAQQQAGSAMAHGRQLHAALTEVFGAITPQLSAELRTLDSVRRVLDG